MENVQDIVNSTRRLGNSTWILRAAIDQPNIIIVAKNEQHANELKKTYYWLCDQEPWYVKLKWRFFGRPEPRFMSVNSRTGFAGYKIPVIFDNGTLS